MIVRDSAPRIQKLAALDWRITLKFEFGCELMLEDLRIAAISTVVLNWTKKFLLKVKEPGNSNQVNFVDFTYEQHRSSDGDKTP